MSFARKIIALLEGLKNASFDDMPPAERRRAADMLRWLADKAEPPSRSVPNGTGVLSELERHRSSSE